MQFYNAEELTATDAAADFSPWQRYVPKQLTQFTVLQFYIAEELTAVEAAADSVNSKAQAGLLPPECFHVTAGKGGSPKRTKFFFGARYLWTREQMSNTATARRAHGVRVDVPAVPSWIQVSCVSVRLCVCAYMCLCVCASVGLCVCMS